MSDEIVVPDIVGEVIGWRAWRIIGSQKLPMLASVTHGNTIWHPDRWTIATCGDEERCRRGGDVPGVGCSCGMYSARSRERLLGLGYNRGSERQPVLIGEVGMVGKVIPAEWGFRAQRARIFRLELPYDLFRYAESLETLYRVPVLFANTLR